MTRLSITITDELMKRLWAEANLLWPGQGMIAVHRLVRDSLKRLGRYCGNDTTRHRGE